MAEFPAMKEAQGKLDAARKALFDVMSESKDETGAYNMDRIKSVSGSKNDKLEWIRAKNEEITGLKAEVVGLSAVADAAASVSDYQSETKGDDRRETKDGRRVSLGDAFVKSAAFKSKGAIAHLDIDLKSIDANDFARSQGWAPESTRSGLVTLKPMVEAPSVVNHLPSIPVTQAAYKYMEETTYTNSAVEVDEGTDYTEAALALTERTQIVQKIGVWLAVTDEQLEDEPGAEAYVNARLMNMIRQKLDLQVLVGSGTGTPTQLLGTTNVSGIQTQALGADTLLDASYKLFTSVRTDGFAEPNVAFVRPTYWQNVALLKTADGVYIYGSPTTGAPSVLWGVPVVQTMAAPSAKLVTGDYANYGFLGLKRGLDVQVTNAHDEFFTQGKQAIRADLRAVMVHVRPKAFGVVTGLS